MPTRSSKTVRPRKLAEMALVRGGAFTMASDRHHPEEAPARRATVGDFWVDLAPVTNAQFAEFVTQTG